MSRSSLLAGLGILYLTATFLVIQYDRFRLLDPAGLDAWYRTKLAGLLTEGDQYRIGMPYLAHFIEAHTAIGMRQCIPFIEAISFGLGLVCLYHLLVRSPLYQAGSTRQRTADLGFFFCVLQFPVLWIFPWERPETLPTFCFLAAITVIILEARVPLAIGCILAVLLSFLQALNRTDAPMIVGLSACLASLLFPLYRRRAATALLGVLCGATGAVTQLYLQHLFPLSHSGQKGTMFQFFYNFNPRYGFAPYRMPAFVVALIPLLATLMLLRRRDVGLDPTDRFTLLIALIYLPVYMAFGIISEVRIYVPYLFLLAPLLAKVWVAFLTGWRTELQPEKLA